jgi:hypothetical protein
MSDAGNNPSIGVPVQGINLNGGVTPGDSFAICAQIGGVGVLQNDLDSAAGPFGGGDYRLRQRQSTTVRLPGYGGGATDTAAVVAFVNGNNTVSEAAPRPQAVRIRPVGAPARRAVGLSHGRSRHGRTSA